MKKNLILIAIGFIITISLKSQNQTQYLIAELQSIKGESGETIKQFATLKTGIDTIKMSFGADLRAIKHRCWVELKVGNDALGTYHFDFSKDSEFADFKRKEINYTFDNSTKKISLEILYSSTLNEVRYIWTNNKEKSQKASIISINKSLEVNDIFPDLTFTQLDGKTVMTKDLYGKCVVINRWFTTCPPCLAEIPGLNKLVEKYKNNKNIVFIAIAADSKLKIENYLANNEFNYIQTIGNSEFNKIFGTTFPTNIVVMPNGIISYNSEGGNENKYLEIEKEIERILEKF